MATAGVRDFGGARRLSVGNREVYDQRARLEREFGAPSTAPSVYPGWLRLTLLIACSGAAWGALIGAGLLLSRSAQP